MTINLAEIRKTVIDSIKASIGADLTQTTNTVTNETYGMVLNARPKEFPIPTASNYAVLDVTDIRDVDWYLTNMRYDDDLGKFIWETHRTLDMQVSIYGENALSLANKLAVSYRFESIRQILIEGGLGLVDVQVVQILPELLQTEFLESAYVQLSVRVNDIYVDPDLGSIDDVIIDGEIGGALMLDPMTIHVDTTNP